MEQPRYVRRLLNQKVLLIIGIVVAVAAGLLAGFTIKDGAIESRVVRSYQASSTVLLTSPQPTYFQVEIPGSTQALPQPQPSGTAAPAPAPSQEVVVTEPTAINLTSSAIILAYLASSDEVIDSVASEVGGLIDGDAITSVRRSTQPAGDEQFGGRLELPIIDIVGVSTSAARAELLAAEATSVFSDIVAREQTASGVPEDVRLVLEEVNAPVAGEGEGSNPAIPIVIVALGVFLLFIAMALIIEAVREGRRRRRASTDDESTEDESTDAESTEDESTDDESTDVQRANAETRKERTASVISSDDATVDLRRLDSAIEPITGPTETDTDGAPFRRRGRTGQTTSMLPPLPGQNDDATADTRS